MMEVGIGKVNCYTSVVLDGEQQPVGIGKIVPRRTSENSGTSNQA